ncbi:GNAT family N-acetyltransferase [Oceanirhabdus sp. W0125-5]|uniref:GNAT family N-acetyltransferase n=1 Tax=Oceanirhabdus sp. W0125-5 TaxID=2999116 RepID=UPI0022F2AFD3|nr:GNAT family N-acetyltransferase [Oceanirhabdus sp. W0125-5]WBW98574.1 hypothetical protein OW730_07405 [Oceanirhabdus sp. W0125-5]
MKFISTTIEELRGFYVEYFMEINGGFDDFFEDIIKEGKHYRIESESNVIGGFSITGDNKLSVIYLVPEKRNLYEKVFERLLVFQEVQGIVTITNDTMMMTQLMRRNFRIRKQACNFTYLMEDAETELVMKLATLEAVSVLEELFGDFLEDYSEEIKLNKVYLGYDEGELVSLGLINEHDLVPNTVSIGMIVADSKRCRGFGTETIKGLINIAKEKSLRVQAGCWFYNHASKKTLLKAGMTQSNMIIRVDEF